MDQGEKLKIAGLGGVVRIHKVHPFVKWSPLENGITRPVPREDIKLSKKKAKASKMRSEQRLKAQREFARSYPKLVAKDKQLWEC